MQKAILFPSSVFSRFEVDESFLNEYDAVRANGDFRIVLYDYEAFVRTGEVLLARCPDEEASVIYRGWMLTHSQYGAFFRELESRGLHLVTTPEQYAALHLFPNVYPLIKNDTPKMLVYPDGCEPCLSEIKRNFRRFFVKDYVKSEKGTGFPKFFTDEITEAEFVKWIQVFKDYRGKLFAGGICIKEFVDLKKYADRTNEWRVFYAKGNVISVSRNSGQVDYAPNPPRELREKYAALPSPFYTVDYSELSDGTWKILEAGDGQVSGLSDRQDAVAFFRALAVLFWD